MPSISRRSEDIFCKRLSSFDSHEEGQILESKRLAELWNSKGNSFDGVPPVAAGVSGLFSSAGPLAVLWGVWAVAVFSLKSIVSGAWSHVRSESGEGSFPASAHCDGGSLASVYMPVLESRITASPYHCLPSIVERVSLLKFESIPLVACYALDAVVALRSNAAVLRSEFMSVFAEIICPTLHTTSIARAEGGMPFLLGVY